MVIIIKETKIKIQKGACNLNQVPFQTISEMEHEKKTENKIQVRNNLK